MPARRLTRHYLFENPRRRGSTAGYEGEEPVNVGANEEQHVIISADSSDDQQGFGKTKLRIRDVPPLSLQISLPHPRPPQHEPYGGAVEPYEKCSSLPTDSDDDGNAKAPHDVPSPAPCLDRLGY